MTALDLYDILRKPLVTEKTTAASEHNKVVFQVADTANKAAVKRAVETLFKVKVENVNTLRVKGKTKLFKGRKGTRSDMKKAIVTLAKGQTIDFSAGV
jgi:large subunit ribosomal protein L23